MKLGFHYHTCFIKKASYTWVPGYIGVFIDALAREVDELYLFLEEWPGEENQEIEYALQEKNITLVPIGPASTFYERVLIPGRRIRKILERVADTDIMLLRMPTPLGPHIINALKKMQHPVSVLLVGNYVDGLQSMQQPWHRKWAIVLLTHYYQWLQNRRIKDLPIMTNSARLRDENLGRTKDIELVKTTTISLKDFYDRDDTCLNRPVRLLFTGRINFQKGLRELVEAVSLLKKQGHDIVLDVVGWEEGTEEVYIPVLKAQARKLEVANLIRFRGRKQIGPELNAFYRQADIYVIPSYHEGFPRTIWEAMANGLPVVATAVGGIPAYLTHEKDSIIIQPRNASEISDAVLRLLNDQIFRKNIIQNGYELAHEAILETQTKRMIEILNRYAKTL